MNDMLKLIEQRYSARVPFDPGHLIAEQDLLQILEGARWAPTAHNMQNVEIVIVDDPVLLGKIGMIETQLSEAFLREHCQLLSSSEDELRQKKVGLLGSTLPKWMQTPEQAGRGPIPLNRLIPACPVLLIVLRDTGKRAPGSEGDVLGLMSQGCVLENMWLVAHSLGIGFQCLSVLSQPAVEQAVKDLLAVPNFMEIAFAVRLGYPITVEPYLRVRREVAEFSHRNCFGVRDRCDEFEAET
jgi:nitroreductase